MQPLIYFVIELAVVVIILSLLDWAIRQFVTDPMILKIVRVVIVVVVVLVAIYALMALVGSAGILHR